MTRTTNARIAGFTFLIYIAATITSMILFARAIRGQAEEEVLAEERLLDGSSRALVRHQATLVALELLLP